jgi:hypothetical protein
MISARLGLLIEVEGRRGNGDELNGCGARWLIEQVA